MVRAYLLALVACGVMYGQEFGDAPPTYDTPDCLGGYLPGSQKPRLGASATNEAAPCTPFWTGDQDDGIVGTPLFDSWSDTNTLTVSLQDGNGYLIAWVDANDDGSFDASERYVYSEALLLPGTYTFTGITIKAGFSFTRNGLNKVAVRVCCEDSSYPLIVNPWNYFWYGEIEDWLIDVEPRKFAVADLRLPDAIEGRPYARTLTYANSQQAGVWSMTTGTLPAGLTIAQSGNGYVLSGTPAAGSGAGLASYPLTVKVTCGPLTATRSLSLAVWPAPATPSLLDDFSTEKGWRKEGTWARVAATAYTGMGVNFLGNSASDPGQDASPTSDNMILSQSHAAETSSGSLVATWATSPYVNCSSLARVQLSFRRWHSHGMFDYLRIEASSDGVNWILVWKPTPWPSWSPDTHWAVADIGWTMAHFDITAVAAGKSAVQVRFGLLCVNAAYQQAYGGAGFCGINVDDVWIGEGPAPINVAAHDFGLNSPQTLAPTPGAPPMPVMFVNSSHAWSVKLDNNESEGIVFDTMTVGVTLPAPAGTTAALNEYAENDGWYPCGSWSASLPMNLAAGAQNVSFLGSFLFSGVPNSWLQPFNARLYLSGKTASTNKRVTVVADALFLPSAGAMPGLHVWEAPAGSPGTAEVANGAPAASLRDFGSSAVGGQSLPTYLICKSTTSTAFTVNPPQLTGTDAAQFELSWATPWNGTPTQGSNSCWFTVRFKPTSAGAKAATVTFAHTAPNTGTPFIFEVKGFGVTAAPILSVKLGGAAGPAVAYGSSAIGALDFGQWDIGAGSTGALTIFVQNAGTQPLILGTPGLSGAQSAEFVLGISVFASVLAPNASAAFTIVFDPATTGAKSARVSFSHNDLGVPTPFEFDVAGEGTIPAPIMVVVQGPPVTQTLTSGMPASGPRDFGLQLVSAGPTTALTFEIRNNGWQALNLGTPTLAGANAGDFTADFSQYSATVSPQTSTQFAVAFDPQSKGAKVARISFSHNDPAAPNPFFINFVGVGDDPNGVVITAVSLVPAQNGQPYIAALGASGGTPPYSFTFVQGNLPVGLTLASDGSLSGTTTASHGVYRFTVRVTDSTGGTDQRLIELIVTPQVGFLGTDPGGSSGGCTTGETATWLTLLLLLIALSVRAKRINVKRGQIPHSP